MRRWLAVGFGIFLASVLACGLDIDVADRASEVVADATTMPTQISQAKEDFTARLGSSAVPDAAGLADREGLSKAFDGLDEALAAATACTDGLQLLVDRDKPSEGDKALGMTRRCEALLDGIHDQIDTPLRTLKRWEGLLDPANTEVSQATTRGQQATTAIAAAAKLSGQLQSAQKAHAYKKEDLQTRFDDVVGVSEELEKHLGTLAGAPDVAALATAIDRAEEISAAALFGAEDLQKRLATLGDTTALVLARLERRPIYYGRVQNWSWSSSTSGDGTMTDLGWQIISADDYNAAVDGDGVTLEYTGSDEYGGSSTEITDWDISFATFATTFTRTNAEQAEPVRSEIDADTFWDLYMVAKGMQEVFGNEHIILEEASAGFTDEDGIPYEIDMSLQLATAQKFAGQYFDEVAEVPSLDGTPLSAVGNEDFGSWEDDKWVWTPAFLAYWRAGGWYKSDTADRFMSGYARTDHAAYRDWRQEAGWGEQYDEDGRYHRRVFIIGSYGHLARFGSHSVRGAGPSARSRGLGGGK